MAENILSNPQPMLLGCKVSDVGFSSKRDFVYNKALPFIICEILRESREVWIKGF